MSWDPAACTIDDIVESIGNLTVGDLTKVTSALRSRLSDDKPGHSGGVREPLDPKAPILNGSRGLKFPLEVV